MTRLSAVVLGVCLVAALLERSAMSAVAMAALFVLGKWIGPRAASYAMVVLVTTPAWFGATPETPPTDFAAPLGAVYAIAPWSPLVPFAVVRRSQRPVVLGLALVAVLAIAFGAALRLPPKITLVAVAACVGAAIAELDASRVPRPLFALGVLAVGGLVARDLALEPDRLLVVLGSVLPSGHAAPTARSVRIATLAVSGAVAAVSLASAAWFERLPRVAGRGILVVVVGVAAGLFLRARAYPELARRVSPGPAFERWSALRHDGDSLGLFGVSSTLPATTPLASADDAARWLRAAGGGRRFVAIGPSDHAAVNAAYRSLAKENVPVVVGDGAFLLAVSKLLPGEANANPFDAFVRSTPPLGLNASDAKLAELDVFGWDVVERSGAEPRAHAAVGRRGAHVRIALAVHSSRKLAGYCTFLHVDHSPTRFGAEHREQRYPMALWQEGDVIIDDFELELPPHFSAGSYAMYWGVGVLPCHDDQRMPIVSGANDGHHRVALGRLEVR